MARWGGSGRRDGQRKIESEYIIEKIHFKKNKKENIRLMTKRLKH